MDRLNFGGDTEKDVGDVESQGTAKMHRSRRSGKRVTYQYIWHSAIILLVLGTLAGLCNLAVQYRVAVEGIEKVGEVREITSKSVMDKVPGRGPTLYVLPVRTMQGTEVLDLGKLRVKRSNDGKVLIRKKRVVPLILGLLIGGGASVGYLGGIGAGVAIAKHVKKMEDYSLLLRGKSECNSYQTN